MIVSIHQPNFMPWLGLFQRVEKADLHIVLDHVQLPRGKGWTNRNKFLVGGRSQWLSLPITRSGMSYQSISDVRLSEPEHHLNKVSATLRHAYHDAPSYLMSRTVFEDSYIGRGDLVALLNENFLAGVLAHASLTPQIVRSSQIVREHPELTALSGNTLILSLAKFVGATKYVSGRGCEDFIDPSSFEDAGIEFAFFEPEHTHYQQLIPDFIPFLSVFDHMSMLSSIDFKNLLSKGTLINAHSPAESD